MVCNFTYLTRMSVQTLWHALKAGGAYVVEDISENYIEKPFRELLS